MPPTALVDDDEHYASSEDSDFAPDDAPANASDQSESDDEAALPDAKRAPAKSKDAADAGYDNSGDEAIIERGKKRKKKSAHDALDADGGGEGGLIKTRSQRAAEYVTTRCKALPESCQDEC
jgi:hypothetical protein